MNEPADVSPETLRAAEAHVARLVSPLTLPRGRRAELRDELLDHLLCEVESRVALGLSEQQALAAARQLSYRHLLSSAVAAAAADRIRRAAVVLTLCSLAWILVWTLALRDDHSVPWPEWREPALLESSDSLARTTPWLALLIGVAVTMASSWRATRLRALIRASQLATVSWIACAISASVYGFARLSLAPHSVGDALKLALVLALAITSAVLAAEGSAWRGARALRQCLRDGARYDMSAAAGT
jgi:hypothetical protein